MRQFTLDLRIERPLSLDNFIPGNNVELLNQLRRLASTPDYGLLYLWGPSGSGRSHLLGATLNLAVENRPAQILAHAELTAEFAAQLENCPGSLFAIDDIERLDAAQQIVLFRLFNGAQRLRCGLVLAGRQPPQTLPLREDLRTRVGQCLIYELKTLSESEAAAALRHHASDRGMTLDEAPINYLLRHSRRDLPSLLAVLDRLDRYTLERKRHLTLPLLREILQLPQESL